MVAPHIGKLNSLVNTGSNTRMQGGGIITTMRQKMAGIAYGKWVVPKYSTSPRNQGTFLRNVSFLPLIVAEFKIRNVILVQRK